MTMDTTAPAPVATDPSTNSTDSTDSTEAADAAVMDLLHEHVPLALLADLAAPRGPPSREILDSEGLPAEQWWRPGRGAA